jgi:hypothetical protein
MNLLSAITTGKKIGPQLHVIMGTNGVGKTTWAASFPQSLILDIENGSNHLDASRVSGDKLKTLDAFKETLTELATRAHNFKTVVVDSVEALEGLISDAVCLEGKVKSIELYESGYGKGYIRSREMMREIIESFRQLQSIGITTILVAHTQVKSHTDPASNQTYDRMIMRCNDKMAALIRDMADNVFYATYKVFTTTENKKTKAFGDGQRILLTQWRPGFDAKNRLELPLELPLSYDAFVEACANTTEDMSEVINDIQEMKSTLDEAMKKTVDEQIEKFRNNPSKLKEIKNRLLKYVAA